MKETKVWVYNGFTELRLPWDGRVFVFPFDKVTEVKEHHTWVPDEYRRNHESDPQPSAILERTYTPEQVAEILLNRHNNNLIGDKCVWVGNDQPTKAECDSAKRYGELKKRELVSVALAERQQALTKGGRPTLDPHIKDWIVELGIVDDTYNPAEKPDTNLAVAEALKGFASAITNMKQPEPVGGRR